MVKMNHKRIFTDVKGVNLSEKLPTMHHIRYEKMLCDSIVTGAAHQVDLQLLCNCSHAMSI